MGTNVSNDVRYFSVILRRRGWHRSLPTKIPIHPTRAEAHQLIITASQRDCTYDVGHFPTAGTIEATAHVTHQQHCLY